MNFYAVVNGRKKGGFLTWNDCNNSIKGYSNVIFKKFKTKKQAEDYIQANSTNVTSVTSGTESKTICSAVSCAFNDAFEKERRAHKETKKILATVRRQLDAMKKIAPQNNLPQSKTLKKNSIPKLLNNSEGKEEAFIPDYYVYTDGSCSNNGQENAVAGIGIFFGINDIRNISQKFEGKQTNNTAELNALIQTYAIIENDIINGKRVAIVSDSTYAIKCVSTYGEKCERKNWNVVIPNKELVKKGYELYKNKSNIHFIYVKAHTNKTDVHSVGNDSADRLAKNAIL